MPRMPAYDWDDEKARTNLQDYRVSFAEAQEVLEYDRLAQTEPDEAHSAPGDLRFRTIGRTLRNRTLVVVHLPVA